MLVVITGGVLSAGAESFTKTLSSVVLAVLAALSVAVIVKLCDCAVLKSAGVSNVTLPLMSETWVIDTPAPAIDQVTGSFAVTEPSAVRPSLTALAMLVVITGGVLSAEVPITLTMKSVLVLLPSLSFAIVVKLCDCAVL